MIDKIQGLSLDALNPEIMNKLMQAEKAFKLGFFQISIEIYNTVMIKISDHTLLSNIYMNIAWAKKKIGKLDEALNDIKKCIEYNSNNADGYNTWGSLLESNSQHEEALEKLNIALKLNPNNSDVFNNLGLVYININNDEKAIECFSDGITINPINEFLYNNLGKYYLNLKEYENAIKNLNIAIKINNQNKNAYLNLGKCYSEKKEYQKAILYFNKAIEIDEKFTMAYFELAYLYFEIEEVDLAKDLYEKCIQLDNSLVDVYNNLGNLYLSLKEYDKALINYDEALKINPNYALVINNQGVLENQRKNNNKALEYYNKAILIKPDYIQSYLNRGLTFTYLNNLEEAFNDFNLVIKKSPSQPEGYHYRAIYYENKKEYKKAITDYIKAIELLKYNKDKGKLYFKIAICYYKLNEKDKTFDYFLNSYQEKNYTISTIIVGKINSLVNNIDLELKTIVIDFCDLYNDIFQIKNFTPPEKLYQYMSAHTLIKFLNKPMLRLSPAKYMNDPLEGLTLINHFISKFKNNKINEILEVLKSRISDSDHLVFIRSLSTLSDSLPLWEMYTDKSSGCNIEINGKLFLNQGGNIFGDSIVKDVLIEENNNDKKLNLKSKFDKFSLYKVRYIDSESTEHEYKEEFNRTYNLLIKLLNYLNKNLIDKVNDIFYYLLQPLNHVYKKSDYKMEEEFRLLYICDINDNDICENKESIELYIETPKINEIKIILGPKFDKIKSRKIKDLKKRRQSFIKIIDINDSKISYR